MENYRILFRIRISHDYFNKRPCDFLHCILAPEGIILSKRRNLIFRQTAPNEWIVLYCQEPDPDDFLTFYLYIKDSHFTLCTDWDEFNPSIEYILLLPVHAEVIDISNSIFRKENRKRPGGGFCKIYLILNDNIINAAKNGEPKQVELHFKAASVQWEYIFITRREEIDESAQLELTEQSGKIHFSPITSYCYLGQKGWITRSESEIPVCADYPYKLRLTMNNDGKQKRTLIPCVPLPELGRYFDAPKGVLRRICYF